MGKTVILVALKKMGNSTYYDTDVFKYIILGLLNYITSDAVYIFLNFSKNS